jgi:large subunit ribosomal protein L20
MARAKFSVARKRQRRRTFRLTKGQFGHRKKRYRQAIRSLKKGMAYAYRDRKVKKRDFRRLWITRISAACKEEGIAYSRFMQGLAGSGLSINRKMISELAVNSPVAFQKLVKIAKEAKPAKAAQGS